MKVAYIAHPVGGNIFANIEAILQIAKQINFSEPETVPHSPYITDVLYLDDSDPDQRNRGMKNNFALFHKGFIDEVRLYGPRISAGMKAEVELALQLGIPVVPMTPETKVEFNRIYI
ncbi:DUF7768 domain-containing protein [Desertivirga xinjiangensis]|uniref:DUF7768 domain-containing protein n=1 Tax=Desertivirga xinjiangensis TaxID=539206 RepID=UPI0021095097|nr:hypothetical protein [Pedobacter xinjiangensis]